MKKLLFLLVVVCHLAIGNFAGATVLTFDDLDDIVPVNGPAPIDSIGSYGGLTWNNMLYTDPNEFNFHVDNIGNSGFENGMVSPNHIAFNSGGNPATITSGVINFQGCYLAGGWRDGLNINVQGYKSGALIYDTTVVVDSTSATWFDFNYFGIDTLLIDSFGGTAHGYSVGDSDYSMVMDGAMFVMDDFTFESAPVPEPATILLLCTGFIGLTGLRKKLN